MRFLHPTPDPLERSIGESEYFMGFENCFESISILEGIGKEVFKKVFYIPSLPHLNTSKIGCLSGEMACCLGVYIVIWII